MTIQKTIARLLQATSECKSDQQFITVVPNRECTTADGSYGSRLSEVHYYTTCISCERHARAVGVKTHIINRLYGDPTASPSGGRVVPSGSKLEMDSYPLIPLVWPSLDQHLAVPVDSAELTR